MERARPLDGIWDVIIVGQGLAGTTLAWRLIAAGRRVLVIDAERAVTSSRIAAGLITPITGPRMVIAPGMALHLAAARAFYRDVEARTGRLFFHERRAVRLLADEAEQRAWAGRCERAEYEPYVVTDGAALVDGAMCDASGGGFAFRGAQLDTGAYLDASRGAFPFEAGEVDWTAVAFDGDSVAIGRHRARRVISCEGYGATRNPYFSWVPFNAAKGDILTVRFHEPVPAQCFHRGIWIAPTRERDVFRVGATYDWAVLDCVPSAAGRAIIEAKLRAFWRVEYTVIDHHAAVRPIISKSNPKMGWHPLHPGLGLFNGLGSKGSLMAPWFAGAFARNIVQGTALPAAADVRAYWG